MFKAKVNALVRSVQSREQPVRPCRRFIAFSGYTAQDAVADGTGFTLEAG
jgi:hypothetical protein